MLGGNLGSLLYGNISVMQIVVIFIHYNCSYLHVLFRLYFYNIFMHDVVHNLFLYLKFIELITIGYSMAALCLRKFDMNC